MDGRAVRSGLGEVERGPHAHGRRRGGPHQDAARLREEDPAAHREFRAAQSAARPGRQPVPGPSRGGAVGAPRRSAAPRCRQRLRLRRNQCASARRRRSRLAALRAAKVTGGVVFVVRRSSRHRRHGGASRSVIFSSGVPRSRSLRKAPRAFDARGQGIRRRRGARDQRNFPERSRRQSRRLPRAPKGARGDAPSAAPHAGHRRRRAEGLPARARRARKMWSLCRSWFGLKYLQL